MKLFHFIVVTSIPFYVESNHNDRKRRDISEGDFDLTENYLFIGT